MKDRRRIQTILNLDTGELIEVDELFKDQHIREAEIFQLRTKIEEQLQTNLVQYVCLYCKQPVAIRGRVNFTDYSKHFYFTHPYDSEDCAIKTKKGYTEEQVRCMKYNGEKESNRHYNLKHLIGFYLEQDPNITDVKIDQVYKNQEVSRDWRKPDVLAVYQDKKTAFELQLSTTFLSVIVARTLFYRQHGIYLIWVFPNFSLKDDLQKFTQKDVYYNNNFNVYILDRDAEEKSKTANELILKCLYKEFYLIDETICDRWATAFIKMSDLKFDSQNSTVWFNDSASQKRQLQLQIAISKREKLDREEEQKTNYKIEQAAQYLKDFYKQDQEPFYENSPLTSILSQKEVMALDQRLKFANENASVITSLFFDRRKPNFLKLLCEQDNIIINTSLLTREEKTVFEELLWLEDRTLFRHYLSCLFRIGYALTEADKKALDNLYQKNYFNATEFERACIERWALSTLFVNLDSVEYAFDILRIDKVLLALASIKYKLVIGSRFSTLIQVTHNFLHSHKEFGGIFLKAMKVYGEYDNQLQQDRTGKLKAKIDAFVLQRPGQNTKYNHVIYELFPECEYGLNPAF